MKSFIEFREKTMLKNVISVACLIAIVGCSSSSTSDLDAPLDDLNLEATTEDETAPSIDFMLQESGSLGQTDGINLNGEGALVTVSADSSDRNSISIANTDPETNEISLSFTVTSESNITENGDGRFTLFTTLFNSLADGGVGTGNDGNAGNARIVLAVRNMSEDNQNILACATVEGDDGSRTPFIIETEDGDGDGCAEFGWFFEYDIEHTITIGVNRDNQTVTFAFDDDVRELASTVAMFEPANGSAGVFIEARGAGEIFQVRLNSLTINETTDSEFSDLAP